VLAKESANFFARKGLKITRTSEKGSSLVLQFGSSTTYLCNEIGKITEKFRFLEKSFDFGLTINKQFRILQESWKSCQQVSPRNRRFGGQPTPEGSLLHETYVLVDTPYPYQVGDNTRTGLSRQHI
jgi:hypothetical protein